MTASLANPKFNENNEKLKLIPTVDLDDEGTYKYILIKVIDLETFDMKYCVRGYQRCDYHADIYDVFCSHLSKLKLQKGVNHECIGGGRIKKTENTIFIYGYSQGFGQADHSITETVIKPQYPNYKLSWSNEGY